MVIQHTAKFLYALSFLLLLFTACQKNNNPEPESRTLFSVDLDQGKFDKYYREAYLAAYTTQGELINYGSLSDSVKWELTGGSMNDTIDILYFEVQNEGSLSIHHFRKVIPGQVFADSNTFVPPSNQYFGIMLRVEDFGNHRYANTSLTQFESAPRKFSRGSFYSGEFDWELIDNGYAYKTAYIETDQQYQGIEIVLFERGTNEPFAYSLDTPADEFQPGDTITMNKSDFTPADLKTMEIITSDNEFNNLFLFTYNSMAGRRDLITSYDQVIPDPSGEKRMKYVQSDLLPITYWEFRYASSLPGATSYTILSNKEIPSSLEINELTGQSIAQSGDQYNFTHGNLLPDRELARSSVTFLKAECNLFQYTVYFEPGESVGTTPLTPFEIPIGILAKYDDFTTIDSLEWNPALYSQTYTEISGNSPIDYLKSTLLNWTDNNSSTDEYSFEGFSIAL
jgi:hypothetical protein